MSTVEERIIGHWSVPTASSVPPAMAIPTVEVYIKMIIGGNQRTIKIWCERFYACDAFLSFL